MKWPTLVCECTACVFERCAVPINKIVGQGRKPECVGLFEKVLVFG